MNHFLLIGILLSITFACNISVKQKCFASTEKCFTSTEKCISACSTYDQLQCVSCIIESGDECCECLFPKWSMCSKVIINSIKNEARRIRLNSKLNSATSYASSRALAGAHSLRSTAIAVLLTKSGDPRLR